MAERRTMVRMAEYAASCDAGEILVSLGLGSCIGCAVIDPEANVAGLAHIVLPESWSAVATSAPAPAKFADTAVPHLIEQVLKLGARRTRLQAVLCGGAHMFAHTTAGKAGSPQLEIGRRNQEETLKALSAARIPIRGTSVGGSSGRSVEVRVATGEVLVRSVGQPHTAL